MDTNRCHMCGKVIEQTSSSGRARIYCSTQCRQRAYRERKLLTDTERFQPMNDNDAAAIIHDLQLDVASCRDAAKRANPMYRPLFIELADGLHSLLRERGLQ